MSAAEAEDLAAPRPVMVAWNRNPMLLPGADSAYLSETRNRIVLCDMGVSKAQAYTPDGSAGGAMLHSPPCKWPEKTFALSAPERSRMRMETGPSASCRERRTPGLVAVPAPRRVRARRAAVAVRAHR